MSIHDDYLDLEDFVDGTKLEDAMDRFSSFAFEMETRFAKLLKENNELKVTIKTMMELKKEIPHHKRCSPYDLSNKNHPANLLAKRNRKR